LKHVLDELQKSQKYHLRQLEDNLRKIKLNEEANEVLKTSNEKHREAITEISKFIESIGGSERDS